MAAVDEREFVNINNSQMLFRNEASFFIQLQKIMTFMLQK